jgi:OHCU decarboxylase
MPEALTVAAMNQMGHEDFVTLLSRIVEGQEWIARAVSEARPFPTPSALYQTLCTVLEEAAPERQEALILAHPELAGEAALRGAVTELSAQEQAQAGLTTLPDDALAEFRRLNTAYRQRFGFPFIICVRDYTREEILDQLRQRLHNARDQERQEALRQIKRIWWYRLRDLVAATDLPPARVGRD